jgi:hypothetical protein
MFPLTDNASLGLVVLIPTFPLVVKIVPTVLLFPVAAKAVVILAIPAVIFVSTKFVDVIFTTVRVPPTFKFPDKLKFAPVIVVAESKLDETVPNEPIVEYREAVDIFVATKFVIVLFVPCIDPELILVVANKVPVVRPVDRFNVLELTFVETAFVIVLFVP